MRDTLKKKKRTNRGRGKEKKREKKKEKRREKRRVGRYGFDYHVQRVSNRSM